MSVTSNKPITVRFNPEHYRKVWRARFRTKRPTCVVDRHPDRVIADKLSEYVADGDRPVVPGRIYFLRSNELEKYQVVMFVRWVTIGNSELPLVKDVFTRVEYITMAMLIPFSRELRDFLDQYPPIEQWNLLCHPHAIIQEKYGVCYRVFTSIRDGFTLHKKYFMELHGEPD